MGARKLIRKSAAEDVLVNQKAISFIPSSPYVCSSPPKPIIGGSAPNYISFPPPQGYLSPSLPPNIDVPSRGRIVQPPAPHLSSAHSPAASPTVAAACSLGPMSPLSYNYRSPSPDLPPPPSHHANLPIIGGSIGGIVTLAVVTTLLTTLARSFLLKIVPKSTKKFFTTCLARNPTNQVLAGEPPTAPQTAYSSQKNSYEMSKKSVPTKYSIETPPADNQSMHPAKETNNYKKKKISQLDEHAEIDENSKVPRNIADQANFKELEIISLEEDVEHKQQEDMEKSQEDELSSKVKNIEHGANQASTRELGIISLEEDVEHKQQEDMEKSQEDELSSKVENIEHGANQASTREVETTKEDKPMEEKHEARKKKKISSNLDNKDHNRYAKKPRKNQAAKTTSLGRLSFSCEITANQLRFFTSCAIGGTYGGISTPSYANNDNDAVDTTNMIDGQRSQQNSRESFFNSRVPSNQIQRTKSRANMDTSNEDSESQE